MKILFSLVAVILSLPLFAADVVAPASPNPWPSSVVIEAVGTPAGVDPQVGAMDFLPDGRLVVAFHRGQICVFDPETQGWTTFAEGLHEPLGLLVVGDHEILVMQRPELTRLRDTDGDGVADDYETVFDDFGMSGNYHEFAYGPARNSKGDLFIALGVASNGAGVREEIRGEWSTIGLERAKMTYQDIPKEYKQAAGRMHGRTPYRGWIFKLPTDGSEPVPYASGLRSPNGIAFDSEDRLFVCDNQGDWLATSKLYHIRRDHFFGHPASLIWRDGWTQDPLKMQTAQIDALRTPASALFPHIELANSPTQPLLVSSAAWGPFQEQLIIGDMNQSNFSRYLHDDSVKDVSQGALVPFLAISQLGRGNNRTAMAENGDLYVGKTQLSWPGATGLVRLRPQAVLADAFAVTAVEQTRSGFRLRFSKPLAENPQVRLLRHTYEYRVQYGSPKSDEAEVPVMSEFANDDSRVLELELNGPKKERYLYSFDLSSVRSEGGDILFGDRVYYHCVKPLEGE